MVQQLKVSELGTGISGYNWSNIKINTEYLLSDDDISYIYSVLSPIFEDTEEKNMKRKRESRLSLLFYLESTIINASKEKNCDVLFSKKTIRNEIFTTIYFKKIDK